MLDKLMGIESRFEQIEEGFSAPELAGDADRFREMMKEHKKLAPIVEKFREYKKAKAAEEEVLLLLEEADGADKEILLLAQEELAEAKEKIASCEKELQILLLPRDPNDDKSVIVEIRGGASILSDLGISKITVMTNNPMKITGLNAYGIEIVGREPIEMTCNEKDAFYLYTKYKKMGHLLHVKEKQKN